MAADDWKYAKESGLRQVTMLSPAEQARDEERNRTPSNLAELRREIARSGPMQRHILQAELQRLTSGESLPSAPAESEAPVAREPDDMLTFLANRRGGKAAVPAAPEAAADGGSMIEFLAQRRASRRPVEEPLPPSGTFRRVVGDTALSLVKGAVAIPEAAVGLADIATGGRVGKFLENEGGDVGFRPKQAKAALDEFLSPEQKAANAEVQSANGIVDVASAALRNPSVIAQSAVESLPLMGAGGVAARGLMAAVPRVGAAAAAGAGEGFVTAGSQAESIRQETKDGLLTPTQAAIAAGSGIVTGGLGVAAGKFARRLGLEDADVLIAGGKGASPEMRHGLVRRVLSGAASEGLIEELPQSVQEQVAQNMALGKPLDEGVDQAAVLGVLTGGAMGAGAQLIHRAPGDDLRDSKVPEVGPLSKAANVALEGAAQGVDANPPAPPPSEEEASALLAQANKRAAELDVKEKGVKATTVPNKDGEPIEVPEIPGQFLTPAEKAEREFLKENGGDAAQLAQFYTSEQPEEPPAEAPAPVPAAMPASAPEIPPEPVPAPAPPDRAAAAQRQADKPAEADFEQHVKGDILNKQGEPFKTMPAALRALTQAGKDTHELVRVQGGQIVRPKVAAPAGPAGPVDPTTGEIAPPAAAPLPAPGTKPQPTTLSAAGTVAQAGPAFSGESIDARAHEAATSPQNERPEPTQAQKESGNYKLGHARWNGLDLSFENPKGSERKGIDPDGKPWSVTMPAHYGYVKRTEGADGDHVDLYMGDNPDSPHVFVIDQKHANGPYAGRFDEHKAFAGVDTAEQATTLYDAGFSDGKGAERRNAVTQMSVPEFKAWVQAGPKTEPLVPFANKEQTDGQDAPNPLTVRAADAPDAPVAQDADRGGEGEAPVLPSAGPAPVQAAGVAGVGEQTIPAEPVEVDGQAAPAPAPEIVEHTTSKGKTIRGTWRDDLTKDQAKAIDPYTFQQTGKGWFVRERHLANLPPKGAPMAPPAPAPAIERASRLRAEAAEADEAAAPKANPVVARLRTAGQKLVEQGQAEQGRDRLTNTHRRVGMAASAEAKAAQTEFIGKKMLRLADAVEAGDAPALAGVTSRTQIELLDTIRKQAMYEADRSTGMSYADQEKRKGRELEPNDLNSVKLPSSRWDAGAHDALEAALKGKKGGKELLARARRTPDPSEILADAEKLIGEKEVRRIFGWHAPDIAARRTRLDRAGLLSLDKLREAVRQYDGLRAERAKVDPIKEAERALVGKKVGVDFFPTPKALAERMAEMAGIEPGMRVLEPSAGNGHLADAARAAGATVDTVEISDTLRDILKAKGHTIAGRDFMEFEPEQPYDVVLMNPPFSDRRDAAHIERAFGLLRPGGRLVAIAGEGVFIGSDAKAKGFRAWMEKQAAEEEKLPANTFASSDLPAQTGANARLLTITRSTAALSRDPEDGATSRSAGGRIGVVDSSQTERVQALADRIASRWTNGPRLVVLANLAHPDAPKALRAEDARQRAAGAVGEPEGFFHEGTVYLMADQLTGAADVVRVLFHEALGHYGLRGVFGAEMGTVLDRMAVLQSGKVRAKARQYGLDMDKQSDRRVAAEEVLAEMAQTTPELGWVQRAIAVIRSWMRERVPGFGKMALTDSEVVRQLIEPARAWVERAASRKSSTTTMLTAEAATAAAAGVASLSASPMLSRSIGDALEQGLNNVRDVKLPAGYLVGDLMDSAGKLSWWHKSVGTMHNLAKRSPEFRRVYDATQSFLNDVSAYATEAADMAPRILPKLESWKDITKSPIKPEDAKAISAPIFEGTLTWARDEKGRPMKVADLEAQAAGISAFDKAQAMLRGGHITEQVMKMWQGLPIEQYEANVASRYESQVLKAGVVWTDAELASLFKLTSDQVGLYREFRAATDKSLTGMAISDMVRFGGDDVRPVREAALAAKSVDAAAELLRDHLFGMAAADAARADVLNDTANKMIDKADRVNDLIAHGYAPLSRFGEFTLDVVDAAGDRVYFGMFESSAERARMARQMAGQFAGAQISTGTVSQESYKLFAGVSPETLELFGNMLGLESTGDAAKDQAFQSFLKLTKTTRSAMKRLIERKGIAGFNEDAGRVLAGFVYSNARQTSSNLHMGEMSAAASDIEQQQGQLKDAAVRMVDYVKNPQEEAQALRGLLFAQYLGGSVASAIVNASQPFAVTFPWLSQYGGAIKAGKQMAAALRDAGRGKTGDKVLDAALTKAEEDGIVAPQEVHQLMAQAAGRGALRTGDGSRAGNLAAKTGNALSKLSLAWGKVFGVAEQFNRRVTFIAAYRTAVAEGMVDPAKFAAGAVAETQFTYNKGNKPRWARGAAGSVLFTFKQYSVNYVELLHRMWTTGGPEGKKATLLALAVLFLMSGADGLPFVENIDDVIDGVMQRMGYSFNSKQKRRQFFADVLGEAGGRVAEKGLSGLPGVPIDVAGRMGMGKPIPGTGLLTKRADHTSDVLELLGPVGDFAKRAGTAGGQLVTGNVGAAAESLAPTAARNLVKAVDMANTGMYRDGRGRKVIDTDGYDVLSKAIGFQPNNVARVQESSREVQDSIAQNKLRSSEIADQWAAGLFEGKPEKVQEARAMLVRWNDDNPESRIRIEMPNILKRVRAMREDKASRLARTAPKGMRADVRAALEGAQ